MRPDTEQTKKTHSNSLKLSSSIPSNKFTFLFPDTASENYNDDVEESNENGGNTNKVDVGVEKFLHFVSAPQVEQFFPFLHASSFLLLAAGLWNVLRPVGGVSDATALKVLLDVVPGGGDVLVVLLAVVLHGVHHGLADVGAEEVGGDSSADFGDEDHDNDDGVRVDHAFVLAQCAAAPEESDDKDDDSDNDKDNWSVDQAIREEFGEIFLNDLKVGSEPNKGEAGESDEEVEDEEDVLDDGTATVLHDEAGVVIEAIVISASGSHCSTDSYRSLPPLASFSRTL